MRFEFDTGVTAEEAGFYKPHPAAYAKVLEVLGVRAEEALFVAGSAGSCRVRLLLLELP